MPHVPAFCNNCGLSFNSGIFVGAGAKNITLTNIKSQCPRCSTMSYVPEGVFNFTQDTMEILCAPDRTIEELKNLEKILKKCTEDNISIIKTIESIEKEVPSLSKLTYILPRDRNQFYAFAALVLTIINTAVSCTPEEKANIIINQNIQQHIIQQTISEINIHQYNHR